jgi:hypothetical protein
VRLECRIAQHEWFCAQIEPCGGIERVGVHPRDCVVKRWARQFAEVREAIERLPLGRRGPGNLAIEEAIRDEERARIDIRLFRSCDDLVFRQGRLDLRGDQVGALSLIGGVGVGGGGAGG